MGILIDFLVPINTTFETVRQIQPARLPMQCPLCLTDEPEHWHQRLGRDYWRCRACTLVFVPRHQHLGAAAEKQVYDQHDNRVDDPAYRRFLQGTHDAVAQRVGASARGLDFGCGPGPALAHMLESSGYPTELYDCYYHPDARVLTQSYDFITLTEVIEHLAEPKVVLEQLWSALKPGGVLVIQTQRVRDRDAFRQWRYLHDPTHISFYSMDTFDWLARALNAQLEYPGRDLAVLVKDSRK
ncbi:MAG: class I SAM-dependent methyltransferase [Saccharospirillum sp.]|nr:class I SAM-dependent methyltransferase [Saccharospirillum sp.]